MGRHRNNLQTKKKNEEYQERELSEIEFNLSDIGFKVMVIRMLKELSEDYKELSRIYISIKKDIQP